MKKKITIKVKPKKKLTIKLNATKSVEPNRLKRRKDLKTKVKA